jgi:hypothetical protein
MKWSRVKGMKLKPNCCVACGSTGEMTEEGPPDAYFAEAVDVNWGDSVYLCESCVRVLGELAGMASTENYDKVKKELAKTKKERADFKELSQKLEKRIDRMLDGNKAIKEARKERKKAA